MSSVVLGDLGYEWDIISITPRVVNIVKLKVR